MVTGVILAGGRSKRMGKNKALMRLGNDTLIAHVIRCLRHITGELLLITNSPEEYAHLGIAMRGDIVPNAGALGGIHTGLACASHETVLCVGCDTPFLVTNLLSYLVSVLAEYDAVIPYTLRMPNAHSALVRKNEQQITLQTLCAVYSKNCLPIIELMLNESDFRVHALAKRANVLTISPEIWKTFDSDGVSFFNINTLEDYEKAQVIYDTSCKLIKNV